MGLHHVTRDGEAEAGAAGLPGAGLVDPVEAFEDATEVLGGNPWAKVADAELNGAAGTKGAVGVRYLACGDQDSVSVMSSEEFCVRKSSK